MTNDANEDLLWAGLLDGVGAYTGSPAVMAESTSRLEITLNHFVPSNSVGYRVQDWRTPLGQLRFVNVGNSCGAGRPSPFAALLLIWPALRRGSIAQPMWDTRGEWYLVRYQPISFHPSLPEARLTYGLCARGKGQDGRWHLAAIARYECGNTFLDFAAGAMLNVVGTSWQVDASMFAPELSVSGPFAAGLDRDDTDVRFIDAAGTAIQLHSVIWHMDYESHG